MAEPSRGALKLGGGRAWAAWSVCALVILFQVVLQTSPSVMFHQLERAFHLQTSGMGFFSASFFYTYLLFQIPSGMIIDRWGTRRVLAGGMCGCVVALMMLSWAPNLLIAELSRMLMGLMTAPAVTAAMCVAGRYFAPQRFGFLAGMSEMSGMVGGIVGESMLVPLVRSWGWRATLQSCALFAGVLVLVIWLVLPTKRSAAVDDGTAPMQSQPNDLWCSLKLVLRVPQIWLNGLYAGLMFSVITGFATLWAVPYLETVYGLAAQQAAIGSSMIFVGAAIGGPLFGALSDALGFPKRLMVAGALLVLALLLILFYGPILTWFWLLVVLFGIGCAAGAYVLPFSMIRALSQEACRGTALGFVNMMCVAIGALIFQPLIGTILQLLGDHASSYPVALVSLPAAIFLALVILPWVQTQSLSGASKDS